MRTAHALIENIETLIDPCISLQIVPILNRIDLKRGKEMVL